MTDKIDSEFDDEITIGDKYGPAMAVTSKKEAQAYFDKCVRHNMRVTGNDIIEAERVERSNIGYYSGYYSQEVMGRVKKLYGFGHPIFG